MWLKKNDDLFRRWFYDNYFDLFIWYDESKNINGFQLCYDKMGNERALTYSEGVFSHNKIDQGENIPLKNLTPILVADGTFDESVILPLFKIASENIEIDIRDYVINSIKMYLLTKKE